MKPCHQRHRLRLAFTPTLRSASSCARQRPSATAWCSCSHGRAEVRLTLSLQWWYRVQHDNVLPEQAHQHVSMHSTLCLPTGLQGMHVHRECGYVYCCLPMAYCQAPGNLLTALFR